MRASTTLSARYAWPGLLRAVFSVGRCPLPPASADRGTGRSHARGNHAHGPGGLGPSAEPNRSVRCRPPRDGGGTEGLFPFGEEVSPRGRADPRPLICSERPPWIFHRQLVEQPRSQQAFGSLHLHQQGNRLSNRPPHGYAARSALRPAPPDRGCTRGPRLVWQDMSSAGRHPGVLAAQRRERARIGSEKGIRRGGGPMKVA